MKLFYRSVFTARHTTRHMGTDKMFEILDNFKNTLEILLRRRKLAKFKIFLIDFEKFPGKELSLCHKLKFSNPYIYGTWCCRLLIFQTKIIWCNRIHSLKFLRSTTLGCRDIGIRKSEFVSKTQFICFELAKELLETKFEKFSGFGHLLSISENILRTNCLIITKKFCGKIYDL